MTHHLSKHRVPLPLRKGLTTHLRDHQVRFQEPASASPRPDGSPADTRLQLLAGIHAVVALTARSARTLIRCHLSQEHLQQQRASYRRANGLYGNVCLHTWSHSSSRQYWRVIHQGQAIRPMAHSSALDAHIASVHSRSGRGSRPRRLQPILRRRAFRVWRPPGRGWNAPAGPVYEGVRWDMLRSPMELPTRPRVL